MYVHLKGIHTLKRTLADGSSATYRYAWRGGPRLEGEPGTPDFMASYNAALEQRKTPPPGIFFTLISEYRASSEFLTKRPATRKDYARYLKLIEAEFGNLPLEALADSRIRGDFKAWRDKMAGTPRAADLAWSVLARVLSVAKDRGRIDLNPCERGGRLYAADRRDKLWTEEMVGAALEGFPTNLRWALVLALWTGQRQGDLLRLPWSAYRDGKIRLRQSKTGSRVSIPVAQTLRLELERIPKVSPVILTSSHRMPWTSDGFRSSWRKACAKAGIADVTNHDLRGSAVTRLAEAGCTVPEIASITGHSLDDVNALLDAHYLSHTNALAESGIRKLERKEARTNAVKDAVKRSEGIG
jgi:integrase